VKRHLTDITCDICGARSGPMEGTTEKARAWGTAVIHHHGGLLTVDACPTCGVGLRQIDEEATRKITAFCDMRRSVNVWGEAES
jgi:hypothetical protein